MKELGGGLIYSRRYHGDKGGGIVRKDKINRESKMRGGREMTASLFLASCKECDVLAEWGKMV